MCVDHTISTGAMVSKVGERLPENRRLPCKSLRKFEVRQKRPRRNQGDILKKREELEGKACIDRDQTARTATGKTWKKKNPVQRRKGGESQYRKEKPAQAVTAGPISNKNGGEEKKNLSQHERMVKGGTLGVWG